MHTEQRQLSRERDSGLNHHPGKIALFTGCIRYEHSKIFYAWNRASTVSSIPHIHVLQCIGFAGHTTTHDCHHTHTHTHAHTHTHTHTHTTHTHTHHTHTHTHMQAHTRKHTHTHTWMHTLTKPHLQTTCTASHYTCVSVDGEGSISALKLMSGSSVFSHHLCGGWRCVVWQSVMSRCGRVCTCMNLLYSSLLIKSIHRCLISRVCSVPTE